MKRAQVEGKFGELRGVSSDDEEAEEVKPKDLVSRGTVVSV